MKQKMLAVACRMLRLLTVSLAVEVPTSGCLEPFAVDAAVLLLVLFIILRKYAEGLTAAPRLLLRSCLAAESCCWGDRLLNVFQQPFTAAQHVSPLFYTIIGWESL